jgi:hypothetical protein
MKRSFLSGLAVALIGTVLGTAPVAAQDPDTTRVADLEEQIEAITREIERLSLGRDVVVVDSSVSGFGPAASRVYRIESGASIGGYGEVLYENFATETEDGIPAGNTDEFDALRAIVYVGYKFNDKVLFNSEIEIEHADEIFLEFAYVEYRLRDDIGLRGGLLLAPMGWVNELHEPPTFLGTQRSVTETRIIPTTWRENGFGLFGDHEAFAWRAVLINSLDAEDFSGSGVRGGRQKGSKALAEDFSFIGRLDYTGQPGLTVGGAMHLGKTGHGRDAGGTTVDGQLFIWDLHADYRVAGLEVRALLAGSDLSDAAAVNLLAGNTGADGVGSSMLGWYVQAGYDVLRNSSSMHQLIPYLGYEQVDTQREVAPGFGIDPANDLTVTSLGLAWKPVTQVVAKVDYQIHSNAEGTGVNQVNFQLGWLF